VGEAPVTPVYPLDSSFVTFPTNRAITVPIFKLCLSLLHSLIMVACSRLRECRSNLILPLFLVCVCNNPTFGCNVENWVVC
jgi:hypothetical protein